MKYPLAGHCPVQGPLSSTVSAALAIGNPHGSLMDTLKPHSGHTLCSEQNVWSVLGGGQSFLSVGPSFPRFYFPYCSVLRVHVTGPTQPPMARTDHCIPMTPRHSSEPPVFPASEWLVGKQSEHLASSKIQQEELADRFLRFYYGASNTWLFLFCLAVANQRCLDLLLN